jgi:hypothetical protein
MVTYQVKQHIIYALIGATGGLIVQLLCILYIKTYPELLNESTESKPDTIEVTKKRNPTDKKSNNRIIRVIRNINFRGVAFRLVPVIIQFLSESGIIIGVLSTATAYIGANNFIKIIYSSSPQNLPIKLLISTIPTESVIVIPVKELEWLCNNNPRVLVNTLQNIKINLCFLKNKKIGFYLNISIRY